MDCMDSTISSSTVMQQGTTKKATAQVVDDEHHLHMDNEEIGKLQMIKTDEDGNLEHADCNKARSVDEDSDISSYAATVTDNPGRGIPVTTRSNEDQIVSAEAYGDSNLQLLDQKSVSNESQENVADMNCISSEDAGGEDISVTSSNKSLKNDERHSIVTTSTNEDHNVSTEGDSNLQLLEQNATSNGNQEKDADLSCLSSEDASCSDISITADKSLKNDEYGNIVTTTSTNKDQIVSLEGDSNLQSLDQNIICNVKQEKNADMSCLSNEDASKDASITTKNSLKNDDHHNIVTSNTDEDQFVSTKGDSNHQLLEQNAISHVNQEKDADMSCISNKDASCADNSITENMSSKNDECFTQLFNEAKIHGHKPISVTTGADRYKNISPSFRPASKVIRKQILLSKSQRLLIEQIGLLEALRAKGYYVKFKYACKGNDDAITLTVNINSLPISHANPDNRVNLPLVEVKESSEGISTHLSKFFAMVDNRIISINRQLKEKDILAGVSKKSADSISIIALNKNEYQRVLSYFSKKYFSKLLQIYDRNICLPEKDRFLRTLSQGLSQYPCVYMDVTIRKDLKGCTVIITGTYRDVVDICGTIKPLIIGNYTYELQSVTNVSYIKTRYLAQQIADIENNHDCQIRCLPMFGNDSNTFMYNIYHRVGVKSLDDKIVNLLSDLVENKGDRNISRRCRIGRFLTSENSRSKLEDLQKGTKSIIEFTDVTKKVRGNEIADHEGAQLRRYQQASINNPWRKQIVRNSGSSLTRTGRNTINCRSFPELPTSNQICVNGVVIELITGQIEAQDKNIDVIVNSISLKSSRTGAIANSLYRAGGPNYRTECENILQTLSVNDIGCTGAGILKCKMVYHIPFLSSSKTVHWLSEIIYRCLQKADEDAMKSIAIPAIGMGQTGIDYDTVAKEMCRSVINFCRRANQHGNLRLIRFVIQDVKNYEAFDQALSKFRQLNSEDRLVDIKDITTSSIKKKEVHKELDLLLAAKCTIKSQTYKIQVLTGTIHLHHLDVAAMLNMTVFCQDHLQDSVLSWSSDSIRAEHKSRAFSSSIMTSSSNCPKLYHICPYGSISDFSAILTCIRKNGQESVACTLFDVDINQNDIDMLVDQFEKYVSSFNKQFNPINRIDLIIGDQVRANEIACWMEKRMCKVFSGSKWQITKSSKYEECGLKLMIAVNQPNTIEGIKRKIEKLAPTFVCHDIDEEECFAELNECDWYDLSLQLWCKHNVLVIRKNKCATLYGLKNDILKTKNYIHQLSKMRLQDAELRHVYKSVAASGQWYVSNAGLDGYNSAEHPFDEDINYKIEKLYEQYMKTKIEKWMEIEDKQVNFARNLVRFRGSEYRIRKSEKAIGSYTSEVDVPETWKYDSIDELEKGVQIIEVTREQNPQEFRKIEAFVAATATVRQIQKLLRVQNWGLYQRYQLRKNDVTAAVEKYKPGTEVERQLYHGTKAEAVDNICKTGFNRDYSGKACGTAHGTGTYFAIQASISQRYGRVLILSRVLTGIYGRSRGSGMPTLDNIPGSKDERIHSVANCTTSPDFFVVSNDNSAYPEYIIHL